MTWTQISFADLSDDQLMAEVHRLVAGERRATAALLRSLIELDGRRLYLREGCSSLFTYCTQVLHLAEGAAYNRIEAARAARRFPAILDLIEDGSLTLTSVRLLAPHLTPDNYREVLISARHKLEARSRNAGGLAASKSGRRRSDPQVADRSPRAVGATSDTAACHGTSNTCTSTGDGPMWPAPDRGRCSQAARGPDAAQRAELQSPPDDHPRNARAAPSRAGSAPPRHPER